MIEQLNKLMAKVNDETPEKLRERIAALEAENAAMKEDFFKLRKDAFLSRLDRWEVMVTAVKYVGNMPK